jgi:hypothetical protein
MVTTGTLGERAATLARDSNLTGTGKRKFARKRPHFYNDRRGPGELGGKTSWYSHLTRTIRPHKTKTHGKPCLNQSIAGRFFFSNSGYHLDRPKTELGTGGIFERPASATVFGWREELQLKHSS